MRILPKLMAGVLATAMLAATGCQAVPTTPVSELEHIEPQLKAPPFVMEHEQATDAAPRVVEFTLTVDEKEIVIDDQGTTVQAMTYNGTIPGPTLVVHEGDYVQLTLRNKTDNMLEHNIDFHAATGAMGGGELTKVKPGEEVVLRFKADRAGAFLYHCAPGGRMTPWHIVSGMSGAILVLPRDGLKDAEGNPLHYDRIYTIGEQDFYIPKDAEGNYKSYPHAIMGMRDMEEVMRTGIPTHVVFNGRVGALTGENALKAKVGETVLILHSTATRDTRPHLIGGHGDYVWERGKFDNPPKVDQETWLIAGGSVGAALYTFKQPGLYAYVNHNLIEAVLKGAAAHFEVEGEWNDDLMTQVEAPHEFTTEAQ